MTFAKIKLVQIYESADLIVHLSAAKSVFMKLWSMYSWDASNAPELFCPVNVQAAGAFFLCIVCVAASRFLSSECCSSPIAELCQLCRSILPRARSRTVLTWQECYPSVTAEWAQEEGSHSASISAPRFPPPSRDISKLKGCSVCLGYLWVLVIFIQAPRNFVLNKWGLIEIAAGSRRYASSFPTARINEVPATFCF